MNIKLYKKALESVKERSKELELKALGNYKKAMQNPQIFELEKTRKELIVDISKKQFHNINSLDGEKKLQSIEQELKNLLENNFGKNFTIEKQIVCDKCKDTGVVNGKVCDCVKKELSNILIKENGLDKNLPTFSTANFEIFKSNQKEMEKLYNKMSEWCNSIQNPKTLFIGFFGNCGSGKTYLENCIISKLIENGNFILYKTAFAFSKDMLSMHTSILEDKEKFINQYLEADVLILDDLGTEPIYKNVTLEYLFNIINERKINNKPTIYSTNLNLTQFEDRYGSRINSRLMDKQCSFKYLFCNDDLRKKQIKL